MFYLLLVSVIVSYSAIGYYVYLLLNTNATVETTVVLRKKDYMNNVPGMSRTKR
jgi:hypothetical protein